VVPGNHFSAPLPLSAESHHGTTRLPCASPAYPSRRRTQVLLHPPLQVHLTHPPDPHQREVSLLDHPVKGPPAPVLDAHHADVASGAGLRIR